MLFAIGQTDRDSLAHHELAAVEVSAKRASDFKSLDVLNVKLSASANWASQDLGTYFDRHGLATILPVGASGAACSIRSQGLSSDHTVLNWFGVPINAVSLGTCDMSMIPVFFFDQATIYNSPETNVLPGSNIGMGINLSNHISDNTTPSLRMVSSYNSMKNFFQGVEYKFQFIPHSEVQRNGSSLNKGNEKSQLVITSVSRVFYQDIRNEFQYMDRYMAERPMIKQNHNDGKNQGVHQDLMLSWGRNEMEGHLWAQRKDILLPLMMGSQGNASANEHDDLFRTSVSFKHKHATWESKISASWLVDGMHYRDQPTKDGNWSIDSQIKSKVLFTNAQLDKNIFGWMKLNANASMVEPKVFTTNFSNGVAVSPWQQLGGGMKLHFGSHQFNADLRKDFRVIKTNPAWTLDYIFQHKKKNSIIQLELQMAHRFRAPDMNELYWNPGGNLLLKAESGMHYKSSLVFKQEISERSSITAMFRAFYGEVHNWIQWVPGSAGIWSPVNYKLVKTSGFEVPIAATHFWTKSVLSFRLNYHYTKTRAVNQSNWDDSKAFNMVYTPTHLASSNLEMRYGQLTLGITHKFTSARYTDEHNTTYRSLAAFNISGAQMGYDFNQTKGNLNMVLQVDNLFNVSYEAVRAYAMPGRVIQLHVQYTFNFKQTK
jgi:vitamin B12 transporter